ncbi:MATE efflux family protein [Clostridioides difficile]|nr:MATE efflux family protein [Clostridioides difficile]
MILLTILIAGFSFQLSNLFVSSASVAQIVKEYFSIIAIGYVLNTVTNCYLGSLNGMGMPTKSMLLMIFYYIIVRMPLAYLLSYFNFGLAGIWVAILISHIVASVAAAIVSRKYLRYKKTGEFILHPRF